MTLMLMPLRKHGWAARWIKHLNELEPSGYLIKHVQRNWHGAGVALINKASNTWRMVNSRRENQFSQF